MEADSKVVIDASVAVKWFNKEEDSDIADDIKNNYIRHAVVIAAPSLIVYEVANALRFNPDFGADQVAIVIRDLLDLQIRLFDPDVAWAESISRIAFERGLTAYDAVYIALATFLRAYMFTADSELVTKAANPRVKLLREYRRK